VSKSEGSSTRSKRMHCMNIEMPKRKRRRESVV